MRRTLAGLMVRLRSAGARRENSLRRGFRTAAGNLPRMCGPARRRSTGGARVAAARPGEARAKRGNRGPLRVRMYDHISKDPIRRVCVTERANLATHAAWHLG